MFLRLLFVLLIALNIAVGAWLLLGQDDVHGRSATDAGVPELHLLSERPPAPSSAPVPASPVTTAGAASAATSAGPTPTAAPVAQAAASAPVPSPIPW